MLITYLRSSSYGAHEFCPQRYYLEYVLGIPSPANLKADRGNITHKALELLARKKLASRNGEATFKDDELDKEWATEPFTESDAIREGWDHYTAKTDYHNWTDKDLEIATQDMYNVLEFNDGMFSPLKRSVYCPEIFFDFEIKEPWAYYDFILPNGQRLNGYMSMKGTADLICHVDDKPGVYEMVDWKTGMRKNWANGKYKTYDDLKKDAQLQMYHYALMRLIPDAEQIIVTIYYTKDGGPVSMAYDRDDLKRAEYLLRKKYEEIRDTYIPRLIYPNWKCERLCHYGKNNWEDTEKTICRHIADEIIELGMDRVDKLYMDPNRVTSYGSGGGRSGD